MPTATTRAARPRKASTARRTVDSAEVTPEEADAIFTGKPDGIPDIEMPQLPRSKAETELILKSLAKTYALIAQFTMLLSIQDGAIIANNIDSLCESWRQLLDDDPKLRKTMLKLVKSSGWGAVISAHLAVGLPIVVNHKDKFAHLVKPKSKPNQFDEAA